MKYISKSLTINLFLLSIKDLTMKCNEEEKSLSPEKPAIQAAQAPKTCCFARFSPDCRPFEEVLFRFV